LEGWWLSNDPDRKWSPFLDEEGWGKLLSCTGFSNNQIVFHDYNSNICHEFSIIVSTAIAEPTLDSGSIESLGIQSLVNVSIVHDETQLGVATEVQNYFAGADDGITARTLSITHMMEENIDQDNICVFLIELQRPVWYTLSPSMFQKLQKILRGPTKSLWVSKSHEKRPDTHLVDGVSRVLNSELRGTALTYLILQGDKDKLEPKQMDHILRICKRLLISDEIDTEYMELHGILHIPRLVTAHSLNKEIEKRQRPKQVVYRKWLADVPLRLDLGSPGLLSTLEFIEDTEYTAILDPQDVEISVKSVGLNFRDILVALGRINELNEHRIGSEMAGVITRIGSACQNSGLQVGDRVAAGCSDAFRTFVRRNWQGVVRLPDEISFSTAAAANINHVTAWLCLRDRAALQPGETILIHSAAGGTGQAAVQVAQNIGATVIATVSTESKKELLMKRYGIPATHIFSSRDTSFAKGVKRLTDGHGADVIFNSLSGEELVASWECIAAYGRFIEIGKKDILAQNTLPMFPFRRNVSFNAFDLSDINKDRPEIARKAFDEVLALMAKGVLHPAEPLQVYRVSELEKAFRNLQSGRTMGKIVVDLRPDDEVTVSNLVLNYLSSQHRS
jgi:NADPH:quinone reductase-like Zn-dependent oxidoreductase